MNETILKYLRDKGYNPDENYYKKIDEWVEVWKGKTDFHKYYTIYENRRTDYEMYSLGMAKRLAEDWASICWTEKDTITSVKKNQIILDESLVKMNFNKRLPSAIEKSAYSGTCGAILRPKNIVLKGKTFEVTKFSKLNLIFLNASQIVPLRVESDDVIDCAFVSEEKKGKNKIYYIEIHELIKRKIDNEVVENYRIRNVFLDEKGQEITKKEVLKEYYINSDISLFSLLRPPVDNPISDSNGLGFAVYGNAIDQLKSVDINYHNFVMDFYLGGKKVFYNKRLTELDRDGVPASPDDLSKQQFQIIGDPELNLNKNDLIYEHNPDLRVNDNVSGLQFSLDLISFKSMLGTKFYQFDSNTRQVTKAEYLGGRQDMVKNAKKYRNNVDEFIINICRGILLLRRIIFNDAVDENEKIEVANTDGFLVSEEELKEQYLDEIAAGLRQPWEYRVKFFGEDEATAKARLKDEETPESNEDDEE